MALLVYDGDCGFCLSCVVFMERRIRPDVQAVPWQECDLDALGLKPEQCMSALQFVAASDEVSSGSRAVTAMLRTARAPWTWLGAVGDAPGVEWVADVAYRIVAANRGTIGRLGSRTRCRSIPRSAHSG